MSRRYFWMLCTPLLWSPAAHGVTSELVECRGIENAELRLACYDRVVDAAAAPPEAASATGPLTGEQMFGRERNVAADLAERVLGIETPDALQATIRRVGHTAGGKLVVELENGQEWVQTDTRRFDASPGDEVVIRVARLGSFLLKKTHGNRSIRVRRVD